MKRVVTKLIFIVLIGTILAGVAVAVTYFCFRKIDFNVLYKDETVSAQSFSFDGNKDYDFSVKGRGAFKVEILPNNQKDFTFTKDGEQTTFSSVGDVTEKFDVEYGKDEFTLSVPKNLSLMIILEQTYDGAEITLPDNVNYGEDFFVIQVTNEKTGEQISCTFGVSGILLMENVIVV